MPENSDANLTRSLFLRREAHLPNLEDIDEDEKNGLPVEESFWQATDMHAAISHEHTTDDAPISILNATKLVFFMYEYMSVYQCVYG